MLFLGWNAGKHRFHFLSNFIFELVFPPSLTIFLAMKRTVKTLVFALGSLALATGAEALADNPYQAIPLRNVFGIGAPPPPPPPPVAPQPPLAVKFTGITTFSDPPQAWFLVPGDPGKPEVTLKLTVGQRQGALELLEILEETGEVRIRNSGTEARLNFREHGNKPIAAVAAAAPATPGAPRPVPANLGQPPAASAVPRPGAPSPVPAAYGSNPAAQSAQAAQQMATGARAIPTRGLRLPQQNQQPEHNLSMEEQVLLIEANRMMTQPQVDSGRLPPLPPTPMSPPAPNAQPQPAFPGFPGQ
jgi:hypothetical protein